jgi:hypothetical protein
VFWGLNVALAAMGLLSMKSSVVATISLTLATALLVGWTATGIANRSKYHAALGLKWVEREIGIYASLVFWAGIFCAGVNPDAVQREPIFSLFQIVVLGGMAGMLVSLIPLSRLLKITG